MIASIYNLNWVSAFAVCQNLKKKKNSTQILISVYVCVFKKNNGMLQRDFY